MACARTKLRAKTARAMMAAWAPTGNRALDFITLGRLIDSSFTPVTWGDFLEAFGLPAITTRAEVWGLLREQGKWSQTNVVEVRDMLRALGVNNQALFAAFDAYSARYDSAPAPAPAPIVSKPSASSALSWAKVSSALAGQLPHDVHRFLRAHYQPSSMVDTDIMHAVVLPTRDWRKIEACSELLNLLEDFQEGAIRQNPAVALLRKYIEQK